MDKLALGDRIARARGVAGMTQEGLGRGVGLDRTAITKLESGERQLSAHELVAIAKVLDRPMSYFVNDPVPAVISRRADETNVHDSTRALDVELDGFASDIQTLLEMGLMGPVAREASARVPRDHDAAERAAQTLRHRLDLGDTPISDLAEVCQRVGLHTFSVSLVEGGPDGGCVEVGGTDAGLGAAVINGDAPAGRRRMTLTHELGHWLFGDAYDAGASLSSERMINSFAIHFLAPRAGVHAAWTQHRDRVVRDRALAVAASFKLSWSAAIAQLRNLGLISYDQHRLLSDDEPRSGDYVRLGFSWVDELVSPYLSPGFAAACLNGYVSGRLTGERVIELLRGTLAVTDLPRKNPPSFDVLRSSFAGHDD